VPPRQSITQYEAKFDLNAMFEFSTIINSSLDVNFILGHLLLTIMGKLLSFRGLVMLRGAEDLFKVEIVKGFSDKTGALELDIPKIPRRLIYVEKEDAKKMPWLKFFRERGIHIIVPLSIRDRVVGIAGFASSVSGKKLGQKEETYIKSLSNVAAGAIEKGLVFEELRKLNRRLDGKFQELNTLFELSKEFNAVLEVDRLIKLLTFSIMGQIGATKYVLCLSRERRMEIVSSRLELPAGDDLLQFFSTVSSPVLVESLSGKQQKQAQAALQELKLNVLIPLQVQSKTKGLLAIGAKIRGEKYTPTDLEFLSSLGNLAMISLENARLFTEAIEKQKLEDELAIAKEIQQGLLPGTLPAIGGFETAAVNISSKQVGGDYYDLISLGDNKYVVAIGDVSGKGTPASLLMANLQATIRALVPLGLPLADLTTRVNDLLCENTSSGRFVTFFWGILDATNRTLRYVSAGHNPPYVFRRNAIERLEKGGIILGVMKSVLPYEEGEVTLQTGDVLVLFTDGVTEAMNSKGEELGEQRLEEIVIPVLSESPQHILSTVVDGVRQHSVNTQQSDDITLIVLKAVEVRQP
jgi:sigma-B regulation protein RsbU (phosphoserine phosphatase)